MNKALLQLISNFLVWVAVFLMVFLFNGPYNEASLNEIMRFFDLKLALYLIGGCIFSFTLFALIGAKSKKRNEQKNARLFSELALDELGSNCYSIGSVCVLLSILLLTKHPLLEGGSPLFFGSGASLWVAGWWLKN